MSEKEIEGGQHHPFFKGVTVLIRTETKRANI
jgi:hypothetical protein